VPLPFSYYVIMRKGVFVKYSESTFAYLLYVHVYEPRHCASAHSSYGASTATHVPSSLHVARNHVETPAQSPGSILNSGMVFWLHA